MKKDIHYMYYPCAQITRSISFWTTDWIILRPYTFIIYNDNFISMLLQGSVFYRCSPSCSVIVSFYTFIYNVDLQLYSITRTFINVQHSKIFRIFHLEYNKRQVSKIASSHDIIDRLKLSSYHIKVLIQNKENHCTNIVSHRILIVLTSSCNIVSRLGQYSYIIPTLLHFHVSGP